MKYTLGIEVSETWQDEKHSGKGEKIYVNEKNKYYCRNCFLKFIEINKNIKYEDKFSHRLNAVNYGNTYKINIFKTKLPNPSFTSEDGMTQIGELLLHVQKGVENYKDKTIQVIMKFGGTFIDIMAIHKGSGKSVKSTLKFV